MNFWQLLKRTIAGIAAGFAAMMGCVFVWVILFPGDDSPAGIGLICLVVGLFVAIKVGLKGMKPQPKQTPTQPVSTPEPPKQEPPKPAEPAQPEGTTYLVAGVSFREQDILEMADESDEYAWSKKEIIDECYTNDKLWRYYWDPKQVELVPEPDNQYDPNAVKVIVDGVHIGYIKKGSCKHVLRLLEENRIRRITCTIGGGPYKVVWEEYDDEKDRDVYTLEKDESPIWAKLKIVEEKG